MRSDSVTETKKPTIETSFGGTVEKDIPDDTVWIDDAFYVKKTRFGSDVFQGYNISSSSITTPHNQTCNVRITTSHQQHQHLQHGHNH